MGARHLLPLALAILGLLAPRPAGAVPDPTRPATAEELRAWRGVAGSGSPDWRLESVLVSDQRRVAVINGRAVSEGDRVNGAEVLAIKPGLVLLRTGDGRLELTLRRRTTNDKIRQNGSR